MVDPKTGKVTDHWYVQLKRIEALLNSLVP